MAALCLTPEMIKAWDKNGRIEFLRLCKGYISQKDFVIEGTNKKDLKRTLYELCWSVIKGQIKVESAVITLQEFIDQHEEMGSVLADILTTIDVEVSCKEDKDVRERFVNMVPGFLTVVPESLLKERLDQDTLEGAGLVISKLGFQQKYVKTKTKLYYKQQKFNLLREESEGYSKLITELNQEAGDGMSNTAALEVIKSLIGCFNLDPNRVLDIIFESFECRLAQKEFFIPLLSHYMSDRDTLCHVLGFKFHYYQQTQDSLTPSTLYRLAALLLSHGLIDLEAIYVHLCPSDSEISEGHKKELVEARAYAKKMTVVVLKDDGKDKDKDDKDGKLDQSQNNQKLGLCQALLDIGDWEHAQKILSRFPPFFGVAHLPVAQALCKLIHYIIEPVYTKHSGLPGGVMKRRGMPPPSLPLEELAIRPVTTWEDFIARALPLITALGPHVATDPILINKLVRIAKTFMSKKGELDVDLAEDVFRGLLTIMDEVVMPAISLLPANCCMSEEIWSFIKLLKYEYRYRLYGQWKNESQALHPKLIRAKADIIDRSKYIMKRLAKENVKPLGRQIGKLSHSNPGILFEYILSQIQKYDNFIGPVVDSLKFLTSLSYDVLAYCIIEALANPERERLKHDDTNISLWLQSLASFSGAVFKKYQIELAGILQYVANQLKAGKSYDLLILREVVTKMAGIEVSEEITNDQLEAMSGGELLRVEGGYFAQVRNTKKSSTRLKEALFEHNLAIPMCILMAQQRNGIVFTQEQEDKRHLKLVGKLYDQCQDTLVQFISFLSLQLSTDELNKRLPTVDELLSTYHVTPDAAFALWRICYTSSINSMYDDFRRTDRKDKELKGASSQTQKVSRYCEAGEKVMAPIMELISPLNTPKVWEEISLHFYTTFWSLTMYDLQVPTAAYDKQKQQLKQQLDSIEDNRDLAQSKKKKEKERCTALIDKLAEEEKKQQEHVKMMMARLKQENENWFHQKTAKHTAITAVLQMCLFPRCCFTAIDATYCAKFLYITHNLKTPNFSSLICYDRIFSDITWALTSCTESEAHRYGRFLCAVLDDVMRWHSDRNIYEKECANYPGFVTVFRNPAMGQVNTVADHLDYENYRHVVHKWHFSLTKVAVSCLESNEYLQIRNALIVLTKVLPHYPRVSKLGQALERRVDRVTLEQKEERPDLYALAMGYCGQLKMRRKTWIADTEFHNKGNPDASKASSVTPKANGTAAVKAEPATGTTNNKNTADKSKDSKKSEGSVTVKAEPKDKDSTRKSKEREAKVDQAAKTDKGVKVKVEVKAEAKDKDSTKVKGDKLKLKDKSGKEVKVKDREGRVKEKKAVKAGKSDLKSQVESMVADPPMDKETKDRDREARKAEARREKEERKKERLGKEGKEGGEMVDRSGSVPTTSSQSSHPERGASHPERGDRGIDKRRSAEPSPRTQDDRDRDIKRRKIESPASSSKESVHGYHDYTEPSRDRYSKDPYSVYSEGRDMLYRGPYSVYSQGRDKMFRSPGHASHGDHEKDGEKERERKERKRSTHKSAPNSDTEEREYVESKRSRPDDSSGKSKLNGSGGEKSREKNRSRSLERHVPRTTDRTDSHATDRLDSHTTDRSGREVWAREEEVNNLPSKKSSKKESPDHKLEKSDRRSADKHPKKSKHR